jgi:hypothetical protein
MKNMLMSPPKGLPLAYQKRLNQQRTWHLNGNMPLEQMTMATTSCQMNQQERIMMSMRRRSWAVMMKDY